MDPILEYHIKETRDRFLEMKADLESIESKMDTLQDFKVTTIATTRITSLIVSAICGFITLLVSTIVAIKYRV